MTRLRSPSSWKGRPSPSAAKQRGERTIPRVKRGGVNTGDIDTVATPLGNQIAIGSGYDGANSPDISNVDDCRARLRPFGPYLAVEDNTACGGMNVTFAGVYSRQP